MPVLNGERYIDEALESILAQTYKNFEVIVVDDGSIDSTGDHVRAFMDRMDVKIVRHPERKGIAISVNDGIRHASGHSITFLDHDDAWFPHMLKTQVTYLEQHPDVGMVHSDFQTIDPAGNVIEESVARCRDRRRPSGSVFQELFMDSFIVATSVLIRKECFDRLGSFDDKLLWGDYHMWLRIARHYKIDYVPQVLVKYRQHLSQSTRSLPVVDPDQEPVAIAAIKDILKLYPEVRKELGEDAIRRRMASMYFGSAYYWFDLGMFSNVRICLSKAIGLWPTNLRYYLIYATSLLKPSYVTLARDTFHRARSVFSSQDSAQWLSGRAQ
jgi:glycosyltransferase involved in cell wall biosynthesis